MMRSKPTKYQWGFIESNPPSKSVKPKIIYTTLTANLPNKSQTVESVARHADKSDSKVTPTRQGHGSRQKSNSLSPRDPSVYKPYASSNLWNPSVLEPDLFGESRKRFLTLTPLADHLSKRESRHASTVPLISMTPPPKSNNTSPDNGNSKSTTKEIADSDRFTTYASGSMSNRAPPLIPLVPMDTSTHAGHLWHDLRSNEKNYSSESGTSHWPFGDNQRHQAAVSSFHVESPLTKAANKLLDIYKYDTLPGVNTTGKADSSHTRELYLERLGINAENQDLWENPDLSRKDTFLGDRSDENEQDRKTLFSNEVNARYSRLTHENTEILPPMEYNRRQRDVLADSSYVLEKNYIKSIGSPLSMTLSQSKPSLPTKNMSFAPKHNVGAEIPQVRMEKQKRGLSKLKKNGPHGNVRVVQCPMQLPSSDINTGEITRHRVKVPPPGKPTVSPTQRDLQMAVPPSHNGQEPFGGSNRVSGIGVTSACPIHKYSLKGQSSISEWNAFDVVGCNCHQSESHNAGIMGDGGTPRKHFRLSAKYSPTDELWQSNYNGRDPSAATHNRLRASKHVCDILGKSSCSRCREEHARRLKGHVTGPLDKIDQSAADMLLRKGQRSPPPTPSTSPTLFLPEQALHKIVIKMKDEKGVVAVTSVGINEDVIKSSTV